MTGEARRIDAHTHFLSVTLARALEARTEIPRIMSRDGQRFVEYAPGLAYPLLPDMVDLDEKLERMRESEIDFAVLSINIPGVDHFPPREAVALAREVNDELVEAVSAHPQRLAALATLPLPAGEAAADELVRAVGRGLHGAMVYSNVAGRPLDDPDFRSGLDAAAALGVPVLLHPTYPLYATNIPVHSLVPVVGFLFDTTVATLRLVYDGVYDRHPDLALILGHAGSLIPYLAGRIDYEGGRLGAGASLSTPPIEALHRLYTDTVSAWMPTLRTALEFFGRDRILFGTDSPFWKPEKTYEPLAGLGLDAEVAAQIEAGNARRLFQLEATVPA